MPFGPLTLSGDEDKVCLRQGITEVFDFCGPERLGERDRGFRRLVLTPVDSQPQPELEPPAPFLRSIIDDNSLPSEE